jgi:Lar family restriction alleviation protein
MSKDHAPTSDELSACPFCGGSAAMSFCEPDIWSVECLDCGVDGKIKHTENAAATAWNRRAAVQPAEPVKLDRAAIMDKVLSKVGKRAYLNGDEIRLDPTDLDEIAILAFEQAHMPEAGGDLAEQYSDMLRKICFEFSAGGYNSEGLMPPATADGKIRWIIEDVRQASLWQAARAAPDRAPSIAPGAQYRREPAETRMDAQSAPARNGAPSIDSAAVTCTWTLADEESAMWQSSCGEAWTFIDGGPVENRVRFCHGCGKATAIAALQPEGGVMSSNSIITILVANAYAAYSSSLQGTDASHKRFNWFNAIKPGDLVMETSTIFMRDRDELRIGFLISDAREPVYSPEEWEAVKEDYEGRHPTERIFRIKLLSDGREYLWENASFIRVPESVQQFSKITGPT